MIKKCQGCGYTLQSDDSSKLGYVPKTKNKNPKLLENTFAYAGNSIILCVLLLIVIMNLVNSTYNPFLYFRF